MSAFRILIADDHEIVRRGIRALIENHPGWEVCAEASDGREAVEKVRELRPDLALVDVSMPNLNGLDAARQIVEIAPQTRVLILTMHESEQIVREVLEVGARGFLLKTDAARDLVTAVEALQRNRMFFTPRVNDMVLAGFLGRVPNGSTTVPPQLPQLTPREREVIQLLAEGKSSKEVASLLNLSTKTAETHRSNIFQKLGTSSRAAAASFAVREGIT